MLVVAFGTKQPTLLRRCSSKPYGVRMLVLWLKNCTVRHSNVISIHLFPTNTHTPTHTHTCLQINYISLSIVHCCVNCLNLCFTDQSFVLLAKFDGYKESFKLVMPYKACKAGLVWYCHIWTCIRFLNYNPL